MKKLIISPFGSLIWVKQSIVRNKKIIKFMLFVIKRILSQFIKDDLLQGLSPHRDIKLMSLTYRKSDLTVVYERNENYYRPNFSDPKYSF